MFGRDLVGDGIFEPKLDSPWSQQGIDGTSRIALKPSLGEKCQDVDISDQRCRSQRQIADIARSDTDAVEGSRAGRSRDRVKSCHSRSLASALIAATAIALPPLDRKSTRLNSSHLVISYAVFCLKKKT